ncbi:MAG: sigma-54-dependent Fis family transcriptional regulator [Gemmatimonadota bacterium]|nr:MAG: sigma-54-dependent Fis family transcriptional regulator [Gemmatimonadota bacterium]
MKSILVIDDDRSICETLQITFTEKGYYVSTAVDSEEGLAQVKNENPDVVILDIRMPKMDGLTLLEKIKEINENISVVIITAYDDMRTTIRAMQLGAYEYIRKPIDLDEIECTIQRALENLDLNRRMNTLLKEISQEYELNNIIGQSKSMREIFKTIGSSSTSRVTVLIRGESGTGKELIAKAIHYNSMSRKQPFVAVNCTAIPETLFESELFGHEKGAFTGAVATKKGKCELAERGTLFFDEIGDISLNIQAKLLRVLQEKKYERVGGTQTLTSEARIVTATNKDLEHMIQQEQFREDLYYRLKVIEIYVPPLRERREDIPLLVEFLLDKINIEFDRNVRKVAPDVMDFLVNQPWKGNVRELENVLRRAVIMAKSDVLLMEYLPSSEDKEPRIVSERLRTLAEMEKEYIAKILTYTNNNKKKTCELLDISRPTLDRKIKKYGLSV